MATRRRVSGTAPRSIAAFQADFALGKIIDAVRPGTTTASVPVRRPDDLLVFDILVDNLQVLTGEHPRLTRSNPRASSYLIIEFPPQSFGEQAFLEVSSQAEPSAAETTAFPQEVSDDPDYPGKNVTQSGEAVPPLPSAKVRMARKSRLSFLMPGSESSLPFTLADVLKAMRTWPLSLPLGALPDPDPPIWIFEPADPSFGKFLTDAVASDSWKITKAGLSTALSALAGRQFEEAVAEAARRVSDRAAGGLTRAGNTGVGRAIFAAIDDEMSGLVRRLPALRDGPAHQATIATLSLAAMESLAPAAQRSETGLEILSEIPYLHFFLGPHEPARSATALKLPYRLLISPIEDARWQHQDEPVEHHGRTELWHTRLTTATDDFGPDEPSKIRAVWSPDYPLDADDVFSTLAPPLPFRMSLDPLDRQMLVKLMAGWDEQRDGDLGQYTPRSSQAKRLQLSALGGLLDAEGNWHTQPQGVDLEQWRHLGTLGRDHYVRVVYVGYLCPFGHAASLVKVSERKFEPVGGNPNNRIAVLRQRFFLVVRERIKRFAKIEHVHRGRNLPFDEVEIVTRTTPDLFEPGVGESKLDEVPSHQIYGGTIAPRMVFWPMVPSSSTGAPADFPFEIVATDLSGRRITFSVPLLFVGKLANQAKHAEIIAAYNVAKLPRRTGNLAGAKVMYAPAEPDDVADTILPTDHMTFGAGPITSYHALAPNFFPETASASVGVPPLQKLLGRAELIDVTYPEAYKSDGFDLTKNAGKVYLQVLTQAHRLEFGGDPDKAKSDTLGALASPQMSILGLSKTMGPVSGQEPANPGQVGAKLENALKGKFDPSDFFKGATILGGVDLATILSAVTGLAGPNVPKLISRELDGPRRVEASFAWHTAIKESPPPHLLIPEPGTMLTMNSLVTTPLDHPDQATYEATADLNDFKVNLFGCIILGFKMLSFAARKGQKPDVAVTMRDGNKAVQFGGPLEFVNTLRELIPSNGFSDPPALTVTPSGISAGYSLTLPALQVGIFALSNASLGAGFSLPFDATPASVKFSFSERQHPFSLTVSLLGGGGFVAIGVSTKGVQEIEAALEFGAAIAIDLGVASGGVEIKAGVYFHWLEPAPNKGSVELAGYVRIHGELSVLGLISASITFNLQLAYQKDDHGSSVWGEATLVVEVEVLFFSADVSVRCRKEFGGSATDPRFIDLVPDQDTWTAYCDAFAEEEVA